MGTRFTTRLRDAIVAIDDADNFKCVKATSNSLYTPLYAAGKYRWMKVMESDGTLVAWRTVSGGDGRQPVEATHLTFGVVIQSEDATSQVKANPLGKAFLTKISTGIFVDLSDGSRRRIDNLLVVFVLPKGAAAHRQKTFARAKKYVNNTAELVEDVVAIEVPRGASAEDIKLAIIEEVRPFLFGAGRPKSET
ncbi:hypothetical protein [Xanthomonas sp. 3498]|uniref:hypothetical protein n=1 Tax=Xanthomonas sp. 3498 TaxID=2663863 RepID=UPI00161D3677|nr:hypothetical protein [Xanthomonas sp. 3498]MBB5877627.1 hypothetical protein [Xanthomonas sp. 3498]